MLGCAERDLSARAREELLALARPSGGIRMMRQDRPYPGSVAGRRRAGSTSPLHQVVRRPDCAGLRSNEVLNLPGAECIMVAARPQHLQIESMQPAGLPPAG